MVMSWVCRVCMVCCIRHRTTAIHTVISASELKAGDFIRFTGFHSAFHLGENANYFIMYTILNWASPADNKVRYNRYPLVRVGD